MHNNQIDPYLYPDVPVLINKLGIKDDELLAKAEVDITCKAIYEIAAFPVEGSYDFNHFCEFHKLIFDEVYEWAGVPRTVPIEKHEAALGYMSIEYAQPDNIKRDAGTILNKMTSVEKWKTLDTEDLAAAVSCYMAELWRIHPFRDGNTRTTITFICQYFESIGILMDRELFEQNAGYMRTALVAASALYSDVDLRKSDYLVRIVKDSLESGLAMHKARHNTVSYPQRAIKQKVSGEKPSVLEAIRRDKEQRKHTSQPAKPLESRKSKSRGDDGR